MLGAIRKRSGGIVVKGLLGLLILSFAMWGVADVYSPSGSDQKLAEVGDVEILPEHVRKDYQKEIDRLSELFGMRITSEQAQIFGVGQSVVQRAVERALFDLAARDLGIIASDAMVLKNIKNEPSFKNANGEFERTRFDQILQANRLTEASFVKLARGDLIRSMYLSMFKEVPLSPESMAKVLFSSRNEQRIAETVTIEYAKVTPIPIPNEADLIQFHKSNEKKFTSPEYRKLTYINLSTSELSKEIAVSDQAVAEAYEENLGEFSEPERRDFQQIRFEDEDTAKQAHSQLKKGIDFVTVAKDFANMNAEATNLGNMKKTELMPVLAKAAFSLAINDFTIPLKSVLGWHILRLKGITPARQKSLAEVKPNLKKQIADELAFDSLYKLANQLEDELGGGASLEEAAQSLNLSLISQDKVDNMGRTPEGKMINNLPGGAFLKVAFSTNVGEESFLTEIGDDGYFIVRVDNVIEPALKKLESIRAKVTEAWNSQQRRNIAKQSGEKMIKSLNAGANFTKLATEKGFKLKQTKPISRSGESSNLSSEVVRKLFDAKIGFSVGGANTDSFTVAKLKQIVTANPEANINKLKTTSKKLSDSIRNDLLSQLATALQKNYPVEINKQAINELF